ncbi:hypothetical protein [Desulfitobacterium sp. AusDCA]|uniref:hypothetical protein n=1 Tax=Desulfitobacterium sp. AusDCA TaxID=3240383 RepID=UPI003DA72751
MGFYGKLKKAIIAIATSVVLLLGTALPAFAVSNVPTIPTIAQQTKDITTVSNPEHIAKVKDALANIPVKALKSGEKYQKTFYVDGYKYVYTAENKEITSESTTNLSANTLLAAPATATEHWFYTQVDAYNPVGVWLFALGYNNKFSSDGTSVTAAPPYFTSSHAAWLVTFAFEQQNMNVTNFGSYSVSNGTGHVTMLATQLGNWQNYYYNGDCTMNADGTADGSIR